jgi:hypothetical protein
MYFLLLSIAIAGIAYLAFWGTDNDDNDKAA